MAADWDRLRRRGIVLIEMNIIIFLCWYISWRPSHIRQTRLDPPRVHAVRIEVMAATPVGRGALWGGRCGYLSQEKYLETSSYISYAH